MNNTLTKPSSTDLLDDFFDLLSESKSCPRLNDELVLQDYITSANNEIIKHFSKTTKKRVAKDDCYERYVFNKEQKDYLVSQIPDLIVTTKKWEGVIAYVLTK
jgi:hypothetical protein